MPRKPSSRLPAGLLASAALDALETPRAGAAVIDRLLRPAPGSADLRLPAGAPIQLTFTPVESEVT